MKTRDDCDDTQALSSDVALPFTAPQRQTDSMARTCLWHDILLGATKIVKTSSVFSEFIIFNNVRLIWPLMH